MNSKELLTLRANKILAESNNMLAKAKLLSLNPEKLKTIKESDRIWDQGIRVKQRAIGLDKMGKLFKKMPDQPVSLPTMPIPNIAQPMPFIAKNANAKNDLTKEYMGHVFKARLIDKTLPKLEKK